MIIPSITLQLFCFKSGLKRAVRGLCCARPCKDKGFLAEENIHTAFKGITWETLAEFEALTVAKSDENKY